MPIVYHAMDVLMTGSMALAVGADLAPTWGPFELVFPEDRHGQAFWPKASPRKRAQARPSRPVSVAERPRL